MYFFGRGWLKDRVLATAQQSVDEVKQRIMEEFQQISVQTLLRLGKEGRAAGEQPGICVRIRTLHSLHPRSPMIRSFKN